MSEHDLDDRCRAYLEAFLSITGNADRYGDRRVVRDRFGDSAEMTAKLTDLVLAGTKTASCSCRWEWEAEGDEPLGAGTLAVIVDHAGEPRCIVETTELTEHPFSDVPESHAAAEGEGDLSLAYWRRVHWDWFSRHLGAIGREPSKNMPILCERFRVVYR